MSEPEYTIVSRVFGDTIPYRFRIIITNAAGKDGRAFTIPSSLLSLIPGVVPGDFIGAIGVGYLSSFVNLAYLINVGSDYDKLTTSARNVLVHETCHVWQGKNSTFALSFVFNSIYNQCVVGSAYTYAPGRPWGDYNVEQQASIVEDWYVAGESTGSPLYHYITDTVRKGDA
jgi:hypothetical protein